MPIPSLAELRRLGAAQQPDWPDANELAEVVQRLRSLPPLVHAGECDRLRERLAAVAEGRAFLLQGGDCAETFAGVTADNVADKLRVLLQMAAVLSFGAGVPVVKVGRIAGQYAKPRTEATETRGDVELPAYRGDAVNALAFTADDRRPDAQRLLAAYESSAATLDLCRGLVPGGFDDFAVSHEALLVDYEHALTRLDPRTGGSYDLSAHLLWIGDRTRQVDGAHVELAARVRNPVAVKLGPTATADDALALAERLNPDREPGRLTFITRLGAAWVRDLLPELVEKVAAHGAQVGWVCDPMHGNTIETPAGYKTRRVDDVVDEVRGFFEVHRSLGTWPGGLHVELTGDDVTECVGRGAHLIEADLGVRYETACDPRLSRAQSLELAFLVADMLREPR